MKKTARKSTPPSSSVDDAAALKAKRERIRLKRARLAAEAAAAQEGPSTESADERGSELMARPVKYVGPYAVGQKVRVRAKAKGWYGLRLWEPGQVFIYKVGPSGKLMSWMIEEKKRVEVERVFEQEEEDDGADEDVL